MNEPSGIFLLECSGGLAAGIEQRVQGSAGVRDGSHRELVETGGAEVADRPWVALAGPTTDHRQRWRDDY